MDEVCHSSKGGTDRARDWVTSGCVGKLFAFDTVLLGGEGERDEGTS
jgi:hypothetical protein